MKTDEEISWLKYQIDNGLYDADARLAYLFLSIWEQNLNDTNSKEVII